MGLENGFPGERLIVLPATFIDLMKDDPLIKDLYICSLGHITHGRNHCVERPKGCDSYTFLYCVWGCGHIRVGAKETELKENQYMILPKNVPLSYSSSIHDPWSIYWICFDGDKGKIYSKSASEPITVYPSINMRIEQRTELFEKIYAILCGGITMEKLEYANQILPHFLATFRYNESQYIIEEQPGFSENSINRVLHYMNDNVERKLTISELAGMAGLSKSYFYRQFYKQMSVSPIEYFIRMKINKAAILLLKTSMSISQIAAKLGFGSSEYFSRTFKRVLGITASEFRKQNFRL